MNDHPTPNHSPADPARSTPPRTTREQDRAPIPVAVRVFIYVIGVHVFAGFLYLLFYLGASK
ncbi:DUF6126 family protein [Streptomyces sp. NBRC 110028]|uniref:DUF6126 family protein n=1 Tax=Streptomyces sp. NBRC 110028 TaxID=1621260 RepID=UPI0006E1E59B|nr:DUF6126 family protein [Streptomyces sp. NBRC 110028]